MATVSPQEVQEPPNIAPRGTESLDRVQGGVAISVARIIDDYVPALLSAILYVVLFILVKDKHLARSEVIFTLLGALTTFFATANRGTSIRRFVVTSILLSSTCHYCATHFGGCSEVFAVPMMLAAIIFLGIVVLMMVGGLKVRRYDLNEVVTNVSANRKMPLQYSIQTMLIGTGIVAIFASDYERLSQVDSGFRFFTSFYWTTERIAFLQTFYWLTAFVCAFFAALSNRFVFLCIVVGTMAVMGTAFVVSQYERFGFDIYFLRTCFYYVTSLTFFSLVRIFGYRWSWHWPWRGAHRVN